MLVTIDWDNAEQLLQDYLVANDYEIFKAGELLEYYKGGLGVWFIKGRTWDDKQKTVETHVMLVGEKGILAFIDKLLHDETMPVYISEDGSTGIIHERKSDGK
jgi:hypothetical protein